MATHQLYYEKLSKTVQVKQPKVDKVETSHKPCNKFNRQNETIERKNIDKMEQVATSIKCGTIPEKRHST